MHIKAICYNKSQFNNNSFYPDSVIEDMKKINLQNVIGASESQSIEWKPSLSQMSDIIEFEHIPMKAWIESGKLQRQEKWLYPPDAIREGLANAMGIQ